MTVRKPGALHLAFSFMALNVKPKVHHIAVLHDIVFTFQSPLAGFASTILSTELNVVVV